MTMHCYVCGKEMLDLRNMPSPFNLYLGAYLPDGGSVIVCSYECMNKVPTASASAETAESPSPVIEPHGPPVVGGEPAAEPSE